MMRMIGLTGIGCAATLLAGMAGAAESAPKELMISSKPVAVHDTSLNPFIVPQGGMESFGDPFPTYWDGVWHLYTLSADLRQVYHLTSTDLVKWSEHAPAMVARGIATGTVVRHDDKYYLFYTDAGTQTIRLVVSDNPWRFDFEKSRLVAKADNKVYQFHKKKFRDCYVFFNEAEKCWWMLIEATHDDKVAVGLFTSQDLLTWTQRDPIFKDGSRAHASCPQVFEHDGRWFLTLLDANTWVYEAGSLQGPWENAGSYHSTHFTAASRYADDGKRRLCWGFFTKRNTPERNVKPEYGGPTGVGRELVFNSAGKLGVRPLPELVAAIREPAHNAALFDCARPLRGTWELDAGKREFRCTGDDGGALLLDLPGENPDYYFEAEIVLASPASRADVLVRTAEALDRGYRIAADAGADEVAIRQARTGGGTFHEKDHPVADGKPVKVQIFVCDSMMEVFVDDHLSLSARVFDRSAHRAAIEITGGRATIRNHLLHYFKEGD
jgi:sucrose-6-phosphate hydrolase SacC (GH32 family)